MRNRSITKRWTLLAVCAALSGWPAHAQTPPADGQNLLSLSATASGEVARDVLTIVFATQREGAEAAAVQAQLMQSLDAALAEARPLARPGRVDVRTGNFSLYPQQPPKGGAMRWVGSAELIVEGRDTEVIARLAGRIHTLSVGRVQSSLSREARDKAQGEIAERAIAAFRSQAGAYAKAFGFGGYTLRTVQVNTGDSPPVPMPGFRAAAPAMSDEALPFEAGRASVNVVVSGTVQLK